MEGETGTETTRELILRVAEQLFMEHGYAAVSMNRVIAALAPERRLTKPALYYHFRDKEALYVAVCLAMSARLRARLLQAIAGAAGLEARTLAACVTLAEVRAEHLQRMLADVREHLSAEARAQLMAAFESDVLAPLVALFDEAAARGELRPDISPRLAAEALLVLAGNLPLAGAARGETVESRQIGAILLRGIAAHANREDYADGR